MTAVEARFDCAQVVLNATEGSARNMPLGIFPRARIGIGQAGTTINDKDVFTNANQLFD
jgi:hypothetical protein